ncbi:MAG: hypothetical protein AAF975_03645, partial [Spirochaetota bacterium]
ELVNSKNNWINDLLNSKSNIFSNPDEESNADIETMLIQLTEEIHGDGEALELKRIKAEREQKQAISSQKAAAGKLSKQLAKLNSSLEVIQDKGSRRYQNAVSKGAKIRQKLLDNPYFDHKEALETGQFATHRDHVIAKGTKIGRYYILGVDPKRNTVSYIHSADARTDPYRIHPSDDLYRSISITQLDKMIQREASHAQYSEEYSEAWEAHRENMRKDGASEQAIKASYPDGFITKDPTGMNEVMARNIKKRSGGSSINFCTDNHTLHQIPPSERAETYQREAIDSVGKQYEFAENSSVLSRRTDGSYKLGYAIATREYSSGRGFYSEPTGLSPINPLTKEGLAEVKKAIDQFHSEGKISEIKKVVQLADKETRDYYKSKVHETKEQIFKDNPRTKEIFDEVQEIAKTYGKNSSKINKKVYYEKDSNAVELLRKIYDEEVVRKISPRYGTAYYLINPEHISDDFGVDKYADMYDSYRLDNEGTKKITKSLMERISWIVANLPQRNSKSLNNRLYEIISQTHRRNSRRATRKNSVAA